MGFHCVICENRECLRCSGDAPGEPHECVPCCYGAATTPRAALAPIHSEECKLSDDEKEGWLDFPTEPGWWWVVAARANRSDGLHGWSEPVPQRVTEIASNLALGPNEEGTEVVVGRAPKPDWRAKVEEAKKRDPFADVYTIYVDMQTGRRTTPLFHYMRWKKIEVPEVPWYRYRGLK